MAEPISDITELKKGIARPVATTAPSSNVLIDMDVSVNFQLLCLTCSNSCIEKQHQVPTSQQQQVQTVW